MTIGEKIKYLRQKNDVTQEKLAEYLEKGGAKVILTRSTDEALGSGKKTDMAERKRIINESGGDALISIHQNAFPSAEAKGAQVFYYRKSEKGRRLAECIQNAITEKADKENTRTAKENENYYLLKNTSMPSVIVECGFLSNKAEEQKLNSDGYQQLMAWSIYSGVLEYFSADEQ